MLPEKFEQAERRRLGEPVVTSHANGSAHSSPARAVEGPTVELFKAIRRRPWLIFASAIVAVLGAMFYLIHTTPVYEASAKLDVQKNTPKLIADSVEQQQINTLYSDSQIIQSSTLLQQAVKSAQLDRLPTMKDEDDPVGAIQDALKVDADPQGQILDISITSTRSEDAATIVNAVVKAYIDFTDKRSQSSSATVLAMLQADKAKNEVELKDLQKRMLDFQRANGLLSLGDSHSEVGNSGESSQVGNNIITTRLAELSELHTRANIDVLNAQVAVNTADSMKNNPEQLRRWVEVQGLINTSQSEPQVISSTASAEIQNESSRIREMEERYGSSYGPAVRARNNLYALIDDYVLALHTQLTSAQEREQELAKELDNQRNLAMNLNEQVAQYDQLSADAARTERLLDTLDNRLKEVDVNSDTRATINILESAQASKTPVYPKRSKVLGIALVLGIMAGMAATVIFDRLDHRLRTIEEVSGLLGLPVLGVIPRMDRGLSALQRGQMVCVEPRSEVAEAYRSLRTALFFGSRLESQTILITSPMPGEGKSLCASNLALALAQTDHRVLLIDCDTRNPTQHVQFSLANTPGLSEVLSGEVKLHSAIIQKFAAERLDLLTCGTPPDNPAELLNSSGFRALIERLRGEYDKIVIDSQPLVPVTDARILSTIADVTILVVRAERSTRRAIEHARDALLAVGGSLVGAVVNDVPRSDFGFYYYEAFVKMASATARATRERKAQFLKKRQNGKSEDHRLLT
jgi:capsular exopolysaccharide synthesis family protein